MELSVIDNNGKESQKVSFNEELIKTGTSKALLHEFVVAYLANQRSGTHSTLTRSEVSGGGTKPWKQKGTGRARSGSTRSPLWRHGGIIFGPKPRDYRQDIPKKKKKNAFKMALQELIDDNRLQVVEPLKLNEVKTKIVANIYRKWNAPTDSIYVVERIGADLNRAARNVPNVELKDVESLNAYDCLRARKIFISAEALTKLSERLTPMKEEA